MVAEKEFKKVAVIAGAGPAGLTAALELLRTTDVKPVIYETEDVIGGISRTARYNGNRMDIGGHRFFSKSDTVMDWWQGILPLQGVASKTLLLDTLVSLLLDCDEEDASELEEDLIAAVEGSPLMQRTLCPYFFEPWNK